MFLENKHQDHSDSRIFPRQVRDNIEPTIASALSSSGTLRLALASVETCLLFHHSASFTASGEACSGPSGSFVLTVPDCSRSSRERSGPAAARFRGPRAGCAQQRRARAASRVSRVSLLVLLSPVRRDCPSPLLLPAFSEARSSLHPDQIWKGDCKIPRLKYLLVR